MKNARNINDLYSRDQLLELVMSYRFPKGENRRTYRQTYEAMKKDGVLPKSWGSINSISKFLQRMPSNVEEKRIENYLMEILNIFIRSIKVTEKDKFHIFFSNINEIRRHEFMDWLGNAILWSGVPKDKVSEVLSKKFEQMGFMSAVEVRRYMPDNFKNKDMQKRKLGKTFEYTGKKTKGAIN